MFKKKACEQIAVLSSSPWTVKEMESELNPGEAKPKRGSFEITVERDDGEEVLVWSGLKKGPPRKEKFPDANALLKETLKRLNE